ncbi:MAG: starvation-sensing protein RspA [Lachnospiraceae bacterium]|nr:starvation-sensing protein RspA [Lachnospiraceae bacterium]
MSEVKIKKLHVIETSPRGDINLVCLKVETNQPGLYGLGCATFTQRYSAVTTVINDFIAPLVTGRGVDSIHDIWQVCMSDSYWRNGPVLNNSISALDEALWDIKGKMAGMPVYELLGGKCREGIELYHHCDGRTPQEVEDNARKLMEQGYRNIRVQQGFYGGNMKGCRQDFVSPTGAPEDGTYYDPDQYFRTTVELLGYLRDKLGEKVGLCHDVHERLTPVKAIALAKELEPFHLLFLEDALPPEQADWFRHMRQQTAVPIAIGELFVNPMEYIHLIDERLIDYIRCHLSMIGGLTPAIKLAHLCEAHGIRTAWHGPFDITPVGLAAQLHLDLACSNFGIQEYCTMTELERDMFPGAPVMRNGYLYVNDKPGFGVDIDEKLATKYPAHYNDNAWLRPRLPDGTTVRG